MNNPRIQNSFHQPILDVQKTHRKKSFDWFDFCYWALTLHPHGLEASYHYDWYTHTETHACTGTRTGTVARILYVAYKSDRRGRGKCLLSLYIIGLIQLIITITQLFFSFKMCARGHQRILLLHCCKSYTYMLCCVCGVVKCTAANDARAALNRAL